MTLKNQNDVISNSLDNAEFNFCWLNVMRIE